LALLEITIKFGSAAPPSLIFARLRFSRQTAISLALKPNQSSSPATHVEINSLSEIVSIWYLFVKGTTNFLASIIVYYLSDAW
jgi:hypothetical protein